MLNIDTLNNVIAVVVVILTLSLIVQSIQALLKKVLAIKSQQLEDSLVDLFEHVIGTKPVPQPPNWFHRLTKRVPAELNSVRDGFLRSSPVLRKMCFQGPIKDQASAPTQLVLTAVLEQFRRMGRLSQHGKWMLDSLSREDLLKVLARVGPDTLVPGFTPKLQNVCDLVKSVQDTLQALDATALPGEANAAYARLQETLAPLLHDYATITTGGRVNTGVLIGDLLSFGRQAFGETLTTLGEIQGRVAAARTAAGGPGTNAALDLVAKRLQELAATITALRARADLELAPLRTKLEEVNTWFDTVMQSFSERYARGMKTWAIVISAVVVVSLNANLFTIYDAVAGSDLLRNNLDSVGADLLAKHQHVREVQDEIERIDRSPTAPTTKPPTSGEKSATSTTPAAGTSGTSTSTTSSGSTAGETPPPTAAAPPKSTAPENGGVPLDVDFAGNPTTKTRDALDTDLAKSKKEISDLVQLYAGFGFEPLTWDAVIEWWHGMWSTDVDAEGHGWGARRAHDARTLIGWLIMLLLLSFGAPFWHDTLESLFGIKNLLRQQTGTKNVEQQSGAGNPKS